MWGTFGQPQLRHMGQFQQQVDYPAQFCAILGELWAISQIRQARIRRRLTLYANQLPAGHALALNQMLDNEIYHSAWCWQQIISEIQQDAERRLW